eukprot:SAG22_NODE_111_length_19607_cov_12.696637_15_plen_134_part_00
MPSVGAPDRPHGAVECGASEAEPWFPARRSTGEAQSLPNWQAARHAETVAGPDQFVAGWHLAGPEWYQLHDGENSSSNAAQQQQRQQRQQQSGLRCDGGGGGGDCTAAAVVEAARAANYVLFLRIAEPARMVS